jgi:hypothetical protein
VGGTRRDGGSDIGGGRRHGVVIIVEVVEVVVEAKFKKLKVFKRKR